MVEGFEAVIDKNCKVLILGTMPGAESLTKEEYYANARNQFWKIVFSLLEKDLDDNYENKKAVLLNNKIAIWDVLKSCDRENSSDSNIKNPVSNDFIWLYSKYPNLKSVYFNGKKAEALYKKLVINKVNREDDIRLYTLPSSSPANAVKFEAKVNEWKQIISLRREEINTDVIRLNACLGGYGGASYEVDIDI